MSGTKIRYSPELKLEAAQQMVDQSGRFASEEFTTVLRQHGIKTSMDGTGRWVDNVLVVCL